MYKTTLWDREMVIETNETLFSPAGLDHGTEIMLKQIALQPADKVLDLGCGSGVVAIACALQIGAGQVVAVDTDLQAVEITRRNAEQNGISGLKVLHSDGLVAVQEKDFTLILSNPPYHADFAVAKGFIEDGKQHLATGGRLVMVVKRLEWYKNKMTAVFGGVRVKEEDGYFVLTAQKRDERPKAVKTPKPVNRKHQKRVEQAQKKRNQSGTH